LKDILKVFVKNNCEKCDIFKKSLLPKLKEKYKVLIFNLDIVDGLSESMFYDIIYVPAIIHIDNDNNLKKKYTSILEAEKELL